MRAAVRTQRRISWLKICTKTKERLTKMMSALHACYTRRNISFFNFCIILSCNCTNCSAIMAAILDFTCEAVLSISETAFLATGNIIGTNIVKITPIEANILQSVQF